MTEMVAETEELGVVEPMGVPGWVRRPIDRLSGLAKAFVALAVIDTVARIAGVIGPPILSGLDAPLATIAGFLPRVLWILLPAIILYRRPDAARSAPWILRGAIVLALTTVILEPLNGLVTGAAFTAFDGEIPIADVVFMAARAILGTAAWLMFAAGFVALRPRPAAPVAAALSSLIAVAFIVSAGIGLFQTMHDPGPDFFPGGALTAVVLNILATLSVLATAYALWAVVRGLGDALRPAGAVRVAVAAATLWATAALLVSIVILSFVVAQPTSVEEVGQGLIDAIGAIGWVSIVVGPTLLICAFAIGLADADLAADEAPTR
jgi:hypothetical protein